MIEERDHGSSYEDRLLVELRRVVEDRSAARPGRMRSSRRERRPGRIGRGVAAAAAVAVVTAALVVVPALRGERGGSPAYAVTTGPDGVVTVEISSIDEADGLQRQLREAGIQADVRLLPTGKLCNPRGLGKAANEVVPTIDDRFRQAASNRLDEAADGALVFSIDPSKLLPTETVVIDMQYAPPEHGQAADLVASVAMGIQVLPEDGHDCDLVDGSVEGWPWQEGAPSSWSK